MGVEPKDKEPLEQPKLPNSSFPRQRERGSSDVITNDGWTLSAAGGEDPLSPQDGPKVPAEDS